VNKAMNSVPSELQSLVHKIEATNVVVAGQLNISTDFRDFLESERQEISDRLTHGICTYADVFRGLCSFDPYVRALAAYRAGSDKISSAIPLLLHNLDTPNKDTILMTVQALGQLRAKESVTYLMKIVENTTFNVSIRGTARSALRNIGQDAVSEDNFIKWISWLSSDEYSDWFTACCTLRGFQQNGLLDTGSIASNLFLIANTNDDAKREQIYWLLSEVPNISKRLLEFEQRFSPSNPYRTLFPILWACCADRLYEPVAERLEEILKSDHLGVDAQNLAALCIIADDERCRQAAERYIELKGESERQNILSTFTCKRVIVNPKALGLDKQTTNTVLLSANEKFNEEMSFFLESTYKFDNKTDMMLVITESTSPISVEHVCNYLHNHFGFIVFDCRFATTSDVRRVEAGLSQHKNVAFMLNRQLHPLLTMMFNWIYEESVVRISPSNATEGHKLANNVHLVIVMEESDYSNLDLGNGWPPYKLTQMLSPIVSV
jgi:hypothetical protein